MTTFLNSRKLAWILGSGLIGVVGCTGDDAPTDTSMTSTTSAFSTTETTTTTTTTDATSSTTTTTTTSTTSTTSTTTTTGVEPCNDEDPLCFELGEAILLGSQVSAIAAIKTDVDSYPDLLAAADDGLYRLENTGNGAFGAESPLDTMNAWGALAVGDINGDGDEDFVAARVAGMMSLGGLIVALSEDDYALLSVADDVDISGLALTDVDGDDNLDVVASLDLDGVLAIYFGDGAGGFGQPFEIPAGIAPSHVIATPIDDDPVDDIAVINYGSVTLGTALIVDDALSEMVSYPLDGAPRALTATSLADSERDLLVAYESPDEFTVFRAQGDGHLDPQASYPLGDSPSAVLAADFTGEDGADVVVALPGLNAVGFWLNHGFGELVPYTTYAVTSDPSALVALPVNDDGRLDLAIASDGPEGGVHLLLSDPVP